MGIYRQKDNHFFYIHIPRTGGRYVRALFKRSIGTQSFFDDFTIKRRNKTETHLHYPLYEVELPVENIPHITVVRNPLNRFLSAMKVRSFECDADFNEIIKDKKTFDKFMVYQNEIDCFSSNWFLEQHKFVTEKTKIWKYEWGFGSNFRDWVKSNTNFEINGITSFDNFTFPGDKCPPVKLNKNIQKWAKEFYKEDYKKFNY